MIRFVYIGNQISEGGTDFAWFNTVTDKFLKFNGTHTWETWDEFKEDYDGNDLERFDKLFSIPFPSKLVGITKNLHLY